MSNAQMVTSSTDAATAGMTTGELHELLASAAAAAGAASSGVGELAAWADTVPRRHVSRQDLLLVTDLLPVDDPAPDEIEATARRVGQLAADLAAETASLRRAAERSPFAARRLGTVSA